MDLEKAMQERAQKEIQAVMQKARLYDQLAKYTSGKLFCSFCGMDQHEVKKLIAGPNVFICNSCVDICVEILEEETDADKE